MVKLMFTCPLCGYSWKPQINPPGQCANRSCRTFLSEEFRERHLSQMRTRYQAKRNEINERNKAWVQNMDPERKKIYKDYQHQYKISITPEQRAARRAYNKAYSARKTEEQKEKQRERWREWKKTWSERHLEARRVTSNKWSAARPEYLRARNQNRRAMRKNAGGSFTRQEWLDLLAVCGHTCLKCGRKEPDIKLTVDHVVPLVKGGSGYIENIQPLCLTCNLRKHDKVADFRGMVVETNGQGLLSPLWVRVDAKKEKRRSPKVLSMPKSTLAESQSKAQAP